LQTRNSITSSLLCIDSGVLRLKQMKPGASYGLKTGLLLLLICLSGCAPAKVHSHWRVSNVVADGYDGEWQGSPQFYDRDRKLTVRVINDAQALFLCISTSDGALKRQLTMGGMTLWIDPGSGESRVFGIHLPGGQSGGHLKNPRPGDHGAGPSRGDHYRPR
jgi:hypothetical protein